MWSQRVRLAENRRYLTGPDGRPTFFVGYCWDKLGASRRGKLCFSYPPGWWGQLYSYWEYLLRDDRTSSPGSGSLASAVQRNLALYAEHGVNLTRIWVNWALDTSAFLQDQDAPRWSVTPFGRGRQPRPDGQPKADLDRFDPVFWESLFAYIGACAQHDILVELVLWFREWGGGPPGTFWEGDFHPENNEQGVDGRDLTDIFAASENSRRLREYEERFVRHLLDEARARDCRNLILEIDHETMDGTGHNDFVTAPPERIDSWVRHWVHFIAEHSRPSPIPVLVHHDSWCAITRQYGGCRYPYATDSELTGLLQYIRDANGDQTRGFKPDPRPIVARQIADNLAGVGTGMTGFDKPVFIEEDGSHLATFEPEIWRRAMWDSLVGGAASFDTLDGHREGICAEFPFLTARVEILRMKGYLTHFIRTRGLPLDVMTPTPSLICAGVATCLAAYGLSCVLYLPYGGSITVDLTGWTGSFQVEWYNPRSGTASAPLKIAGGGRFAGISPSEDDWVLYIARPGS